MGGNKFNASNFYLILYIKFSVTSFCDKNWIEEKLCLFLNTEYEGKKIFFSGLFFFLSIHWINFNH